MDFEALKNILENKKGSKPDFPFDETTLVFKVMGKIFALVGINDDPLRVNLKCDPERAEALQAGCKIRNIIPFTFYRNNDLC